MAELHIFASRKHALENGFDGDRMTLRDRPDVRAWYPSMGPDRLRGYVTSRVVVAPDILSCTELQRPGVAGEVLRGMEEARKFLRDPPMEWVQ